MRYLSGFWVHELAQFRMIFLRYCVAALVFVLWGGISLLLKFNLGWGDRISFILPFLAALASAHYVTEWLDKFSFYASKKIILESYALSLETAMQRFPSAQASFVLMVHKHYQILEDEPSRMVFMNPMTHQTATSASPQLYAVSEHS